MRLPFVSLSTLAALPAFALGLPSPLLAQVTDSPAGQERIDIGPFVTEAAQRFGIPEHWIYAVIRVESAGRTRAVSSAGAMGLMQLMPGTWARQRTRYALGADPFDPRDNILAGTSYLREMHDLYGAPGFLAAYNAGPARYKDWRAGRRTLPLETRRYLALLAPLVQPERVFVAAIAPPDGTSAVAPVATSKQVVAALETNRDGSSGNPFARPAQPSHDLFAPVSERGEP